MPSSNKCDMGGEDFHGIKFTRQEPDKVIALCHRCVNEYSDTYALTHGGERPEFDQYRLQPNGKWKHINFTGTEPEDL